MIVLQPKTPENKKNIRKYDVNQPNLWICCAKWAAYKCYNNYTDTDYWCHYTNEWWDDLHAKFFKEIQQTTEFHYQRLHSNFEKKETHSMYVHQ